MFLFLSLNNISDKNESGYFNVFLIFAWINWSMFRLFLISFKCLVVFENFK